MPPPPVHPPASRAESAARAECASEAEPASGAEAAGLAEAAQALERVTSWLRRAIRPAEWNAVALSTLDAVARTGPHRISYLVSHERITQPGMTGIVDRLGAGGVGPAAGAARGARRAAGARAPADRRRPVRSTTRKAEMNHRGGAKAPSPFRQPRAVYAVGVARVISFM